MSTTPSLNVVTPETTAPAPRPLPCVQLPCPACGETIANVALNLWTLDDATAGNFTCCECNEEFSLEAVRGFIAAWTPFLRWLEGIPGGK